MDIVLLFKALLLGIVEGFTEFLPVSSTGHLIIVGQLLGFHDEKSKIFEVVIQGGAMLAVLWEYRHRFAGVITGMAGDPSARRFVGNLLLALLPAALLGILLIEHIKALLFNPVAVAFALIAGGFVMLWAERREHTVAVEAVDDIRWRDALKIGGAQIFALIPGVSRSGATIIGGLLFGLSRRAATEFSFFLAVPTLLAASLYDFYRNRALFTADDIGMFVAGITASFVSAFICVRWLLRYITTHDFSLFAWYRIGFGCLVLVAGYSGVVTWS